MLQIYKKGQGRHTRLWTAVTLAAVVALGCYQLHLKLSSWVEGNLWVAILAPVATFGVLAGLVFLLVNRPSTANFMIAAEGEMKKVSWSSREEIIVSTTVVIIVVVFMAVLLGLTDLMFRTFFSWLLA